MDDKLQLAIDTIYSSLTVTWKNNGNIMADAVRDHVLTSLSELTGLSIDSLEKKIEQLVEDGQQTMDPTPPTAIYFVRAIFNH